MTLLQLLRAITPRKALLTGTLLAAAACGGGSGGGGGGPSPSIVYQSKSAQPQVGAPGDNFTLNATVTCNDGTLDEVTAAYNGMNKADDGTYSQQFARANSTQHARFTATCDGVTRTDSLEVAVQNPPTITSATATPTTALQGDTVSASLQAANASDVSIDNSATPANPDNSAAGQALSAKYAAVQNFTLTYKANKPGFASATQTIPIAVTPLTGTATPDKPTGTTGQVTTFTLTSPAGTDSLDLLIDGAQTGRVQGSSGNVQYTPTTAGSKSVAVKAYNAAASTQTNQPNYTVDAAPATLHVTVNGVNRAVIDLDGTAIDVPADTTLDLTQGAHTLGIRPGQTQSFDFGEMTLGTTWYPLSHPNTQGTAKLAYNVNINSAANVVYDLLARSTFSAAEKAAHDTLWVGADGNYHPTKIVNWEVWALENPPTGVLSQLCSAMQPSDLQGLIDAIPIMTAEDAAGGEARRNFTYQTGDPIAAGKLTQLPSGAWRVGPGVLLACRSSPGGQSNTSWYDTQGFFDAYWARSGGGSSTWMSEIMGNIDFVNGLGKGEIDTPISRHWSGGGLTRLSLDDKAWAGPLLIAWKAGQNGYGLLKGIQ